MDLVLNKAIYQQPAGVVVRVLGCQPLSLTDAFQHVVLQASILYKCYGSLTR